MATSASIIEKELYFAQPILRQLIFDVRHQCIELSTGLSFFPVNQGQVLTMKEFQKRQSEHFQSHVKPQIHALYHLIVDQTSKVCDQLLAIAKWTTTQDHLRHLFTGSDSYLEGRNDLRQHRKNMKHALHSHSPLIQWLQLPGPDGYNVSQSLIESLINRPAIEEGLDAKDDRQAKVEIPTSFSHRRKKKEEEHKSKWTQNAIERKVCQQCVKIIRLIDYILSDHIEQLIILNLGQFMSMLEMGVGSSDILSFTKQDFIRLFHQIDTQNTLELDQQQIERLLRLLYREKVGDVNEMDKLVKTFVRVFDEDGNGDVSLEEYLDGLDRIFATGQLQKFDPTNAQIYQSQSKEELDLFQPIPIFQITLQIHLLSKTNKIPLLSNTAITLYESNYVPSLPALMTCIRQTVASFTDMLSSFHRVLEHPHLSMYVSFAQYGGKGISSDRPHRLLQHEEYEEPGQKNSLFPVIIARSKTNVQYQHLVEKISEIAEEAMRGCQAYANCFHEFVTMYQENQQQNVQLFRQEYEQHKIDIPDFRQAILEHQSQHSLIKDLIDSKDIQVCY